VARRGFRPRALGEIAIRTRDMAAMVAFYRDILGLELLQSRDDGRIVFLRIADGFAGHTAVVALFSETAAEVVAGPEGPRRSSLHHLALSLPRAEQAAAEAWFERHGVPCRISEFPWIGWRGLFVNDPDGNTVELVAYDVGLLDP
jgi:catechol 2,3-dioxygenase-like lactoylglutathione lyase family enzyme